MRELVCDERERGGFGSGAHLKTRRENNNAVIEVTCPPSASLRFIPNFPVASLSFSASPL